MIWRNGGGGGGREFYSRPRIFYSLTNVSSRETMLKPIQRDAPASPLFYLREEKNKDDTHEGHSKSTHCRITDLIECCSSFLPCSYSPNVSVKVNQPEWQQHLGCSSVVERLPALCKALGLTPRTKKAF